MYRAYLETLDGAEPHVVLEAPGASCAIFPKRGFNLYSWIVDGRQLLMSSRTFVNEAYTFGIPVLFPTPNRVRDCKFTFEGKEYPQSRGGEPLFIHGLVNLEEFAVQTWQTESAAYCRGSYSIAPGTEAYESFPFACTLELTYCLSGKGLRLDYRVINDGEGNLPWGFAIHPYFTKFGDPTRVRIHAGAEQRFEAEETLLPTGRLLPAEEEYNLRNGRMLIDCDLDDVFHGEPEQMWARVDYLDWGKSISLKASEEFRNMVIYTAHERAGFCIENQTCSTDAHNLYARGLKEESGLIITPAGKEHAGWIELNIE